MSFNTSTFRKAVEYDRQSAADAEQCLKVDEYGVLVEIVRMVRQLTQVTSRRHALEDRECTSTPTLTALDMEEHELLEDINCHAVFFHRKIDHLLAIRHVITDLSRGSVTPLEADHRMRLIAGDAIKSLGIRSGHAEPQDLRDVASVIQSERGIIVREPDLQDFLRHPATMAFTIVPNLAGKPPHGSMGFCTARHEKRGNHGVLRSGIFFIAPELISSNVVPAMAWILSEQLSEDEILMVNAMVTPHTRYRLVLMGFVDRPEGLIWSPTTGTPLQRPENFEREDESVFEKSSGTSIVSIPHSWDDPGRNKKSRGRTWQ
jgi:hypothetical protein